MTTFSITAATSVFTTAPGDTAFSSDSPGADKLTVAESAFLIAAGASAEGAFLSPTGAWTVTVNGSIVSQQAAGLDLASNNPAASTITIGADGEVSGSNAGMIAGSTATIANSGEIDGGSFGIELIGDFTRTITNSGIISGAIASIVNLSGNGADKVTNSGTLHGEVDFAGGNDTLTNSGSISSNVVLGDGTNKLTNSGSIAGTVNGGADTDTLTNTDQISGAVDLFDGTNKLTNQGSIFSDVDGGGGNDTFTNTKLISGDVHLGSGANTLTNSGTIGSLASFDMLLFGGNVLGGTDNDIVTNSGKIGGDIDLGAGDNKITNSGTIGADAATTIGHINFGIGDDKLTNTGTIDGHGSGTIISLGDGTNTIANKGTMNSVDVVGGADDDTLTNSGKILLSVVSLGDGTNTLVNSGTLSGNAIEVAGGSGSDTVTDFAKVGARTVNGSIFGIVDLKDGDDVFHGGSHAETVEDGNGGDTIKLGGGNDTYIATANPASSLTADGQDTIDGGKGVDTYDASAATSAVQINLDSVAHFTLAASQASGADVANASFDTVTGFENAKGGAGGDTVDGSGAANSLEGGAGNDTLTGFGGQDTLAGGTGADVFFFASLKDSGLTKATRDVITDFNHSDGDQIDLHSIDANTTNGSGDDAFTFIGTNAKFTETPGELRAYWTAKGQVIEGDVNGDGKADFSIEIVDPTHGIALSATNGVDFLL